jgi:hypothetical protein
MQYNTVQYSTVQYNISTTDYERKDETRDKSDRKTRKKTWEATK